MTNQRRMGNNTAIRASDAIFSAIRRFFLSPQTPQAPPNGGLRKRCNPKQTFRCFCLGGLWLAPYALLIGLWLAPYALFGRAMACAIRPFDRAMPAAYALLIGLCLRHTPFGRAMGISPIRAPCGGYACALAAARQSAPLSQSPRPKPSGSSHACIRSFDPSIRRPTTTFEFCP